MTKASTFVRGWLGFNNKFYQGLFHDCFISIEPEKLIHIILKNVSNKDEKHKEMLTTIREHPYLLRETAKDEYLIFDFQVASHHEEDLDNFVLGKYSKLSDTAKELTIMSHEDMENVRNLAVILYPEKRHREKLGELLESDIKPDAEIYDKPDISKEIFKGI